MSTLTQREFAIEVVKRLRESGHEAYWAGGCVRDLLLGLDPSDFDVATDARPEHVMKLFRRTFAVGASFGVVRVLGTTQSGDVEVATFRSDGIYRDGRRPESVTYSTAEFDASRRDFTINGMFYDPVEARVIDYVQGRADLDRKILRAIGEPSSRFAEDKLRLLRAVRFAARFDLEIDPATRKALETMSGEVTSVAVERIAQELRKMLIHPTRFAAMNLAYETGLIAAVLPQLVPREDRENDDSVWYRTREVLAKLPETSSFTLAMAALLHKLGPRADLDTLMEIARFLKLPNSESERVAWLVANQECLIAPQSLRQSRLKRILASQGIDDLLQLHRAIALASTDSLAHIDYCEWYLSEQPDGPINPPPLLTGHDLVRHGLKPGPKFADWLNRIRDAQLDQAIHNKDEALALMDQIRDDLV